MLQSQNDTTIRYDANSSGQVSIQQSRLLLWSWVKFYFFQEIQRGVKPGLDSGGRPKIRRREQKTKANDQPILLVVVSNKCRVSCQLFSYRWSIEIWKVDGDPATATCTRILVESHNWATCPQCQSWPNWVLINPRKTKSKVAKAPMACK